MILGIGTDIVDIRRIETLYARFGNRFLERTFSKREQDYALSHAHPAQRLAKRFAAKEAFAKAVGQGFSKGMAFKEVSVVHDERGRPTLTISGKTACILQERWGTSIPLGCRLKMDLSLSDEYPYAIAFVVLSYEKEL